MESTTNNTERFIVICASLLSRRNETSWPDQFGSSAEDIANIYYTRQDMAFFDTKAAGGGKWKPTFNETVMGEPNACFMCKGSEVSPDYRPTPCGCFSVCKRCAMKCATGGKCRLCKQYFTNMTCRPINVVAAGTSNEE